MNSKLPNELTRRTILTTTLGRRMPCHCQSGKRYKNCCYAKDAAAKATENTTKAPTTNANVANSMLGIPGEEASVLVTYVKKDGTETPKEGGKGAYDVVFYFRKPGAVFDNKDISLDIDQHFGSSLLGVASPAVQFKDKTFDGPDTKIKLYVATSEGYKAEAFGSPNKEGFLSDLRVTLDADSVLDAENKAKMLMVPAISALSFSSDITLQISHTVVREKATGVTQRDIIVPFQPAATMMQPHAQAPEARALFNRYRDGLNSDDPNWRFLCFASIVEQLWKKTKADKSAGLKNIVIPKDDTEFLKWFKSGFPGGYALADQNCLSDVPAEARGKTTDEVITTYIKPLRHTIAHSLLEDGTMPTDKDDVKHQAEVRRWAPLLRCITRIHLQAVFKVPTA